MEFPLEAENALESKPMADEMAVHPGTPHITRCSINDKKGEIKADTNCHSKEALFDKTHACYNSPKR